MKFMIYQVILSCVLFTLCEECSVEVMQFLFLVLLVTFLCLSSIWIYKAYDCSLILFLHGRLETELINHMYEVLSVKFLEPGLFSS